MSALTRTTKDRLGYVLAAVALGLTACANANVESRAAGRSPIESPPDAAVAGADATQTRTLNGSHFDVVWLASAATAEDAGRVLGRAEEARSKLVELLGARHFDTRHIRIRLAGEGGPGAFPTVDPESGDVLLYRFPGPGGEYESPLAHELVHAMRLSIWTRPERQTDPALFWEEGYAEVLAREVGFPSSGFPLYGVAPEIGAASFIVRNEALAIPELVTRHRSLNFRCMAQAYVERISFMTDVRRRFGLAPIIEVADIEGPLEVADIEKQLGASIADLAAAHDEGVAATLSRPGTREDAIRYRETTPIRYFPVCPGRESRK